MARLVSSAEMMPPTLPNCCSVFGPQRVQGATPEPLVDRVLHAGSATDELLGDADDGVGAAVRHLDVRLGLDEARRP